MQQGIFQSLVGHFKNGVPINAVSPASRKVLTVMDAIWDIIDTRLGSYALQPNYGIPDILPDTIGRVPTAESKLVEEHLKKYVPVFVPNVRNIYFAGWSVDAKGCFCECMMICIHKDRSVP